MPTLSEIAARFEPVACKKCEKLVAVTLPEEVKKSLPSRNYLAPDQSLHFLPYVMAIPEGASYGCNCGEPTLDPSTPRVAVSIGGDGSPFDLYRVRK